MARSLLLLESASDVLTEDAGNRALESSSGVTVTSNEGIPLIGAGLLSATGSHSTSGSADLAGTGLLSATAASLASSRLLESSGALLIQSGSFRLLEGEGAVVGVTGGEILLESGGGDDLDMESGDALLLEGDEVPNPQPPTPPTINSWGDASDI